MSLSKQVKHALADAGFPVLRAIGHLVGQPCPACGERFIPAPIPNPVSPRLAAEWNLSPQQRKWMGDREGMLCSACRCNSRARQMAAVIVDRARQVTGRQTESLAELVQTVEFRQLRIAEINACHGLQEILKRPGTVTYSEYGSKDPSTPSEDLLSLSYPDESFDLVLTSDTIEHVPDIDRAMAEIWRVLRPGGAHIFTAPVLMDRPQTLKRASLDGGGALRHHQTPSYHGDPEHDASDFLVFYEFGADFPETVRAAGFELQMITDRHNPTMIVFEAARPG